MCSNTVPTLKDILFCVFQILTQHKPPTYCYPNLNYHVNCAFQKVSSHLKGMTTLNYWNVYSVAAEQSVAQVGVCLTTPHRLWWKQTSTALTSGITWPYLRHRQSYTHQPCHSQHTFVSPPSLVDSQRVEDGWLAVQTYHHGDKSTGVHGLEFKEHQ